MYANTRYEATGSGSTQKPYSVSYEPNVYRSPNPTHLYSSGSFTPDPNNHLTATHTHHDPYSHAHQAVNHVVTLPPQSPNRHADSRVRAYPSYPGNSSSIEQRSDHNSGAYNHAQFHSHNSNQAQMNRR